MKTAFQRAQAHALTQPEPWEPDTETCATVQEFVAFCARTVVFGPRDDSEAIQVCKLCGEVDTHTDSCPLPALAQWLEQED